MPTGYTACIEDGTITTGRDFLMLCARAFGATASMREEPLTVPIPELFEEDSYYTQRLKETKAELERCLTMSDEELQRLVDEEHESKHKHYEAMLETSRKMH